MENEKYTGQELQVEVIDVFKDKSAVWIENENASGEYVVEAPANINFAKVGPATIKFNAGGNICYIRSNAAKPAYNKPYTPNAPSNGFKKPWTPTRGPSQPFQSGSTFKPKEDVDWDKIAVGKCKHAFLIEAFKMGMPLDEAELKANLWARASMAPVPEGASIEKAYVTQQVKKLTKEEEIKKEVDKLMGVGIPEEDLGVY